MSPGLPVRFEQFDTSRLGQLRDQEHLEDVIAGAEDEFARVLLLKNWVAAQWPAGTPDPYPPWDAIVILDWIRTGVTGGFCGQYAQLLLQSLAALGMSARYVELGRIANPYAHFVVEVWSNQFNKWVVLDADYNVHFERNGIPLSALEVHDALVRSTLSDVTTVGGDLLDGHSDPGRWPLRTAELYYYVRAHLKADHLTAPNEPPFDRFNDMVEWLDELTVPWEFSTVASPYPKERLTSVQTGERSQFERPLNQVYVTIQSHGTDEVQLGLENNALQFDRYQVREIGFSSTEGDWRDHEGAVFLWRPSPITRVLEIRAVNMRGVTGPASVLQASFSARRR